MHSINDSPQAGWCIDAVFFDGVLFLEIQHTERPSTAAAAAAAVGGATAAAASAASSASASCAAGGAPSASAASFSTSPQDDRMTYYGYKFEALCTVLGGEDPDDAAVDATSEYAVVVRFRLGSHRVLMAAEVDCYLPQALGEEEQEGRLATTAAAATAAPPPPQQQQLQQQLGGRGAPPPPLPAAGGGGQPRQPTGASCREYLELKTYV